MTGPQIEDDGLFFGPCLRGYEHGARGTVHTREGWQAAGSPFIRADAAEWTDEQLARFTAEWRKKWQDGTFGPPRLLTPLPRRVRARLAVTRVIDTAAIWLAGHGRLRAAERLWGAAGMWRR